MFSLHDFYSHENLGKAVSAIVANGPNRLSPKVHRAALGSGIGEPPILSLPVEADFKKDASWLMPGDVRAVYKSRLL